MNTPKDRTRLQRPRTFSKPVCKTGDSAAPRRVAAVLCIAEIFGMAGISTFPALLPQFMEQWSLTHTQAGWITAIYYAGYMIFVPILVGVTDRVDAKKIMAAGVCIGAVGSFGFAAFAVGFRSAMLFRFLAGISLAGTYMPGLKVVSDHTEGSLQSRYISFYTASFSIGASLSYLLAGEIASAGGWRHAFAAAGLGPVIAFVVIVIFSPSGRVSKTATKTFLLSDLRKVVHSRLAMGFIAAYAAHMWELFSFRSWIVAFLVYSRSLQPVGAWVWSATQVAFLVNLIGLPASIMGNEWAWRADRVRVVSILMLVSASIGAVIGFLPALPYVWVVALVIVYGIGVTADSASLTAGAIGAAPEGYRGATMALHSTIGFGAAFVGPLTVGMLLDFFGSVPTIGWGIGFLCMALGCASGPMLLKLFAKSR